MKYVIENIRRGKGDRSKYVYACLYSISENGEKNLEISATLDYVCEALHARLASKNT